MTLRWLSISIFLFFFFFFFFFFFSLSLSLSLSLPLSLPLFFFWGRGRRGGGGGSYFLNCWPPVPFLGVFSKVQPHTMAMAAGLSAVCLCKGSRTELFLEYVQATVFYFTWALSLRRRSPVELLLLLLCLSFFFSSSFFLLSQRAT